MLRCLPRLDFCSMLEVMQKDFFQFGKLRTGKDLLLVLKNEVVFEHGQWQGFLFGEWGEYFEQLALSQPEWLARDEAEENPDYQQIIPWALFRVGDKYLELKRQQQSAHTRLYHRYSLGVGGHVFQDELEQYPDLKQWIKAKFLEEIQYQGQVLSVRCIGVVNDNSDSLGKHHFGIVYLIEGDSQTVASQKYTQLKFSSLSDMSGSDIGFLDRWSQMVYHQLADMETL